LAQPRYDRGVVPDTLPASRILLLLNRPAEREAGLQKFLADVHRRGAPTYHQWLTPEGYGRRFGPADADVQAAQGWLRAHGFDVTRTAKGGHFIEFSGTAGQLRTAFHTEIHQYEVDGESHYANSTEVSIPAALVPLVRGISPLNNFHAKPYLNIAGPAHYSRTTDRATPLWTIPNPLGTKNPYFYPVAPGDFATQYDLAPLYQAGVNGSGQTIGIINESNIDLSLIAAYQTLFGLPSNPTQVVVDGEDPGRLNGVDVEAYLDVELSGAVAPQATVNLYIANGSNFQDPLVLAAIRAVEDNQASVLSVSFGQCETFLGNAGNQFWSQLWEQAAAQGQTVLVASGDSGVACNLGPYPAVSGVASTPWNVAVGGTDFYYSDYATGGASADTLWRPTNDSSLGSLIAPLPEQGWSDSFGLNVFSNHLLGAGGGGPSNCATQNSSACSAGYPKPNWQVGPGTQTDTVRDLPDVSLFAANGSNLSTYPICALPGDCAPGTDNATGVFLVGGTSSSAPAMAGIMALIDQKYGRQGQANYTLYALAQQKPAAFHDITLGNNRSICTCNLYSAASGYDLATGLGSVDANVLVNDWNAVTYVTTTTSLTLSSTKITHGSPITVTASVVPASGSGKPSGAVSILTTAPLPASQGQAVLNLTGGTASGSIDFFPGGYYNVLATYSGDSSFGRSTSTPVALTVTPENSNINFQVLNGYFPNPAVIANGGTVQYGTPLTLDIQPSGVSAPSGKANGNATGSAAFKVDSTAASVALTGVGVASWTPPALSIGNHTASVTYSGDASFNASSANPITFSVTPGQVSVFDHPVGIFACPGGPVGPGGCIAVGSSLTVGVTVQGANTFAANPAQIPLGLATPTGTVQVCLVPQFLYNQVCVKPVYTQTATLAPVSGPNSYESFASVTFPNLAANLYYINVAYSGDSYWESWGLEDLGFFSAITLPPLAPTTTTVSITPSSFSGSQTATITATVTGTGNQGTAPTGEINFFADTVGITYAFLSAGVAGKTNTVSFEVDATTFLKSGANQLVASYQGDATNGPSISSPANFTSIRSAEDFSLASQLSQLTLKSGSSGTVGLNLTSLSSFSGAVALSCTPSSSQITCAVNPPSPTLNGSATATLTINASASAALAHGLRAQNTLSRLGWLSVGCAFMFGSVVLTGSRDRKRRLATLLSLGIFAGLLTVASCGSGSGPGGGQQPPPPPPNSATYSVLVSASANGIIHNAKVVVVVH
jgi:hypothetical protein